MKPENKVITLATITYTGILQIGDIKSVTKDTTHITNLLLSHSNVITDISSFTKPVPDAKNIVIGEPPINIEHKSVYYASSYLNAFRSISFENHRDIYITGSRDLYKHLLPMSDELYLIIVEHPLGYCSTDEASYFPFFPDIKSFDLVAPTIYIPGTPISSLFSKAQIVNTIGSTMVIHFTR